MFPNEIQKVEELPSSGLALRLVLDHPTRVFDPDVGIPWLWQWVERRRQLKVGRCAHVLRDF